MPPDASVGVLHTAFLPGTVRIAEVAFCDLHRAPGGELGAAIEGHSRVRRGRQGAQCRLDPPHDRQGPSVRVGEQNQVPALPLDQRRQVGCSGGAGKNDQISFPVPEHVTVRHLRRPPFDATLSGKRTTARL